MFIFDNIFHSIIRNKGRSIIYIVISFLLVCFTGVYFGSISSNERLLATLGERIPVSAAITNTSGSQEIGLEIMTQRVDKLLEMGLTDVVLVGESYGNVDKERMQQGTRKVSSYITGTNTISAFTLPEEDISIPTDQLGFLAGSDGLCLISSEFAKSRNLAAEVGTTLELNLFRARYDPYGTIKGFESVCPAQLKVAGFYEGHTGIDSGLPDIICPAEWLRQQYAAVNVPFYYNSAKGTVADPLRLNDFKQQAEQLNFKQVNPQAGSNRDGTALAVNDRLFIQSASQIMRSIRTLRLFTAPVIALIIMLTALTAFFLMRSRRQEISIARCLGRKKLAIAMELMLDGFLLSAAGGLVAALLMGLLLDIGWAACLYILLGFMACELVGSCIPVAMLSRVNPMGLLSRIE